MLTHLLFYIYIDTPNCKKMGIFVANGHPVVLIQNVLCTFFLLSAVCSVDEDLELMDQQTGE